jgi:hypothetical protein
MTAAPSPTPSDALRPAAQHHVPAHEASDEAIRSDIAALARQLRTAAKHVSQLDRPERPGDARRLVRSLRSGADRGEAVLAAGGRAIERARLLAVHAELLELGRRCSRYLVRDGVRRILAPGQFAAVEDSVVLVGELAKVAFGELLHSARFERLPNGRRRCSFDVNPLHAFTPAIAAGHAWAREHVRVDEVDHAELVARLIESATAWYAAPTSDNLMVHPTSAMTADALAEFMPEWIRRSDDGLVRELDRLVDRVLPSLDGCGVEPLELERWVHVGATSGILRTLQVACPDRALAADTCDVTILLPALVAGGAPADRE